MQNQNFDLHGLVLRHKTPSCVHFHNTTITLFCVFFTFGFTIFLDLLRRDNKDEQRRMLRTPAITMSSSLETEIQIKRPSRKKSKRERKKDFYTLVFLTKKTDRKVRRLADDIRRLLPHSTGSMDFEPTMPRQEINAICDVKDANFCIFFESRVKDTHMWMARSPFGPSIQFQVLDYVTLENLNLQGNCHVDSQIKLSFDKSFEGSARKHLIRAMITECMCPPDGHPKVTPFVERIMSFTYDDDDYKIYCRHYQIVFKNGVSEPQQLTEIGPRMTLRPLKIFEGSFGGKLLYSLANEESGGERPWKPRGKKAKRMQLLGIDKKIKNHLDMEKLYKMQVLKEKSPSRHRMERGKPGVGASWGGL